MRQKSRIYVWPKNSVLISDVLLQMNNLGRVGSECAGINKIQQESSLATDQRLFL